MRGLLGAIRRNGRRLLVAALAGLLLAASLPPWGWWPLAFAAVAVLDVALHGTGRRGRLAVGWVAGIAWLAPSTVWMLDFSPPGYVAAAFVLSVAPGLAAAAVPGRAPWRWVALPGALAVAEFARWSFPFGGVPLSTVPMSQAASPFVVVARLGGGVLLTLVVVTGGVALRAAALRHRRGTAVALAAVVVAVGVASLVPRAGTVGSLDVAVVQGGGPQRTRAVDTDPALPYRRHLDATATITGPVDLVLWPENVVTVDGFVEDAPEGAELAELARRLDTTLLPGVVEGFDDHFRNASLVFTPDGTVTDRYDKVQRVPFGEYVPFRSAVDLLSGGAASTFIPRDARAGTGPARLDTPVGRLAIVISWEVFFERRARDGVGDGGEVLLNPTNGSSYWLTIVQSQQVASSRLRAVESDRWVLQAAPTGFSAVVDPDGTVVDRTGVSETRVLRHTVDRRTGTTPAVRTGPWPWLVVAVGLVVGATLADRRTARPGAVTPRAGA